MDSHAFKYIYNKYFQMLYGIAMEITSNKEMTEHLLIQTFKVAFSNNLLKQKTTHCVTLIRLLIQTAEDEFQREEYFKFKSLENAPFIHRLLCEKLSLVRICEENQLSMEQGVKSIREEFKGLRKSE